MKKSSLTLIHQCYFLKDILNFNKTTHQNLKSLNSLKVNPKYVYKMIW